jgi:hypothetical protein
MKIRSVLNENRRHHSLVFVFYLVILLAIAAGLSVTKFTAHAGTGQSNEQALSDSNIWHMQRWSPYWVGIGIGLLSWIAFVLSDKPIGVSTAYAQTSGMIEKAMQGRQTEQKAYYREFVPQSINLKQRPARRKLNRVLNIRKK